jgi:hypothetical protein
MATVADRRYSAKANCKWYYTLATMILTSGQNSLRRASMIVGCRFDFSLGKGVSRQASSDFFRLF